MRRRLLRHALGRGVDPEALVLELWADAPGLFWLDSGAEGTHYLGTGTELALGPDPLAAARRELEAMRVLGTDGERDARPGPAFRLGLVGWLGYGLRARTTATPLAHPSRLPDAALLRVDRAVAVDAVSGEAELLALGEAWSGELAAWRDEVEAAVARIAAPGAPEPPLAPPPAAASPRWHLDDEAYLDAIRACQAAIVEGEAYQLCLTNEVVVEGEHDALALHRRLRRSSPTHHGALIRAGGVALVSASPERFLEIDAEGGISTSPIKGTRPRGRDAGEDAVLAAELLASEKERAENLMIVDLMRNDLSRVCELGSVEVTRLLEVEHYAQVHQLVSTVRGRLAPGLDALDALASCFPAGSMTGAPKRRATQLLDGLERRARGPYSGCLGWLGADGAADLAMTIRTIVVEPARASIGSGGGITARSVPEEELEEVRIKARPLLAALGAEG
ncbi:anthranilate synthase component I family protein [Homoserinibacter sp. YIM 151385]|uniref:anthranilate synthase component I family protein n=1 Tax=Homoserinibacter sp. YIM 151385 TaxID=2985506 RepID=UPI0022F0DFB2|nr:anthranilate synthase component I family protein [Homoserinibacter sp. YIM 151385]WBU38949.1 anthranilate synthase component I family protein [Homoserinibacter sp. YIM 151385]